MLQLQLSLQWVQHTTLEMQHSNQGFITLVELFTAFCMLIWTHSLKGWCFSEAHTAL
jgi:hypothetical protein